MSNDEDEEQEFYEHVWLTARRFRMCIKIVSRGSTFRATSRIMDNFAIDSGVSIYRGCAKAYVSNQTRVVVLAHLLRIFSGVAKHLWCFSLALDGSTHQGLSYLDVRWRFLWKGSVQNFHLVALPMFERHSGEYMFEILQTFLLAVFGIPCTQKCTCESSDGAANMRGNTGGPHTAQGEK